MLDMCGICVVDTFEMDMCGICKMCWICVGYVWCEIRQQSSEEPCDETSFGKNTTLPKTNIAPENGPSQKEMSIPTIHFQGLLLLVSGRVLFSSFFPGFNLFCVFFFRWSWNHRPNMPSKSLKSHWLPTSHIWKEKGPCKWPKINGFALEFFSPL